MGSGRRVLVVPAFPAAGRTCVGGVVLDDGRPVSGGAAASDLRGGVCGRAGPRTTCFRPEPLRSMSCPVTPCRRGSTSAEARSRCATPAPTTTFASSLSHWAGHSDVVLAGTAATIASAVAAVDPRGRGAPVPERVGPALIVCGSLHPMALAQVAAAESAGAIVLVPESDEGGDPAAVAVALGERALRALDANGFRTVVLVGGDTTAEVLGDAVVSVGGTVAPGVAWSRPWGESGPLVLTKPGGFGTRTTLVDLLAEHSRVSGSLPMAITMGDASGVGPEIVLRTGRRRRARRRHDRRLRRRRDPRHGCELLGVSVPIVAIDRRLTSAPGALCVVDAGAAAAADHRPGELDAASGAAARGLCRRAPPIDALAGDVAGIVTMPMNKEATQLTDPRFVGHTEFIAERCGAPAGDDDARPNGGRSRSPTSARTARCGRRSNASATIGCST